MLSSKKPHMNIAFALIISVFTIALVAPTSADARFPDTNLSEINRLAGDGIVGGFPDGNFHPNRPVTRGEAIVMIGRTLDLNTGTRSTSFRDVPSNHFASGAIAAAVEKGLVSGYPDGTFKPNDPVTRGETAAFLTRAHNMEPIQNPIAFRDVSANHFAKGAIDRISSSGITVGFSDNTYRPDQHITRQEFAVLLARTIYPELRLKAPEQRQNPNTIAIAKVVNTSNLTIRSGPGTNHGIVGSIARNTEIQVLDTVNNWAKIDHRGGVAYASLSNLQVVSTTNRAPLRGKTIVVDPGHGGSDPGAIANGLREKDVVLDISLVLQRKLRMAGANVVMTRTTDVFPSLDRRVQIANNSNGHAFVSVHANASTHTAANGTETYWNRTHSSASSQRLARLTQNHLVRQLGTRDRGIHHGNFRVISQTRMPSILVEVGFLTNRGDADKLRQNIYKERSAEGIYRGLVDYFN
ncbi:N-acetylmuramoyl-L-alanine amidase [Evansella vedderi]|uniref:N-acetylmuramoyl-L-alanine amidase n=1 Tax=Evansella vedderi TaxID=38282 RepID=A0ABU0A2R5_9BACI|nr:N-acetylmuramoyl-L-alanine amidase [Evansella vedderi]MDQ0257246.1 N-acetylmuramoyl-L-alanine amidase [Evansella vedderi]